MRTKITVGIYMILPLIGFVLLSQAFAQTEYMPAGKLKTEKQETEKLQTEFFLIGIKDPLVIPNFRDSDNDYFDAVREGKTVKLFFRDMKEVRFLKPGTTFESEVLFHDGKKETYILRPAGEILVESSASISAYSYTKVARIVFSVAPPEPPAPVVQPVPQPRRLGVPPPTALDRVLLKNGDTISGQVQTVTFTLRTAYGRFHLEMPRIASIEFDDKGTNTSVVLRNGDRFSGTLEEGYVLFVTTAGQGINFESKMIKTIQFKR